MHGPQLAFAMFAAALLAAALVPLVRRVAVLLGAVDRPGGRRSHQGEVPRLGGVAIFGATAGGLVCCWVLGGALPQALQANPAGVGGVAAGGTLMFLLGAMDDVWGLRPLSKLGGQVLAAALAVWGGCRIEVIGWLDGTVALGVLAAPLTALWIVGITNAWNLLDGLDGLAAGVAILALGSVLAIAAEGHCSVAAFSAVLLGATAGFWLYNLPPASIFLGDSGSQFLGFCVGVLTAYAHAKQLVGSITTVALLLVALPLGDTAWAIGRRYLRGLLPLRARSPLAALARIFVADRGHLHHRLLALGLSPRQAVLLLFGIQAGCCLLALYLSVLAYARASASPPGTGPAEAVPAVQTGPGTSIPGLPAARVRTDGP
ncbi:MAG: undecaprenyl-phosphate alpha-N-acetylglucosaminyl 1-phosphate transferase [Planctomycetota bacterium]|nr:MAG: undecaprenyl-phosphate alpha-N-acetylglucosaminyl 1-phosphate transferase [Planctomycetota bacterium]